MKINRHAAQKVAARAWIKKTETVENETLRANPTETTMQERLSAISTNRDRNGFRTNKRRAKKVASFKIKAVAVPVTPNWYVNDAMIINRGIIALKS